MLLSGFYLLLLTVQLLIGLIAVASTRLRATAAYFLVSGNTIFNHGSTGFAAGQGTGFEYTVAPWIQYEAYAIKVS